MLRNFLEEVHCTPTELADEVWEKSAKEQIILLSCLNTRFFKNEENGHVQMASMALELDSCDAARKANVKNFVSKLYEYLVEK